MWLGGTLRILYWLACFFGFKILYFQPQIIYFWWLWLSIFKKKGSLHREKFLKCMRRNDGFSTSKIKLYMQNIKCQKDGDMGKIFLSILTFN